MFIHIDQRGEIMDIQFFLIVETDVGQYCFQGFNFLIFRFSSLTHQVLACEESQNLKKGGFDLHLGSHVMGVNLLASNGYLLIAAKGRGNTLVFGAKKRKNGVSKIRGKVSVP